WNGKITVNGSLSLDGTAEEIEIDGIKLTPVDKQSRLYFSGLAFSDMGIKEVYLNSLKFPAASGYVYIDSGKLVVRLDDEPLELTSFAGDVKVDTSLRLAGMAGKLYVPGQNKVNVE
ncbi:MAG: hypothetical protein QXD77_01360, partial [Candidatus Aenigmatarchaeota archaeon]